MSQSKPTLFINQLTFTRFIAAILVFGFHFARGFYPFETPYIKNFVLTSNIAVPYFFLLSGFILTYVYYSREKKSIKSFWTARLSRIYPLYFFALFLDTVLKMRFWTNYEIDWHDTLLNIFLIQSWFEGKQLSCNGPGWSLSVELFFYLIFPFLLYYFLQKKSFNTIIVTCISFWVGTQIFHILSINYFTNHSYLAVSYNPLVHLGTFLIGTASALIFIQKQTLLTKISPWSLMLISIPTLILISLMLFTNPIIKYHHSGLFSPLLAISIIGLAIHQGFLTKLFSKKIFIYLGEISYGIYILQYPTLYLLRYLHDKFYLPHWQNLNMYYHLILLVLFSIISYHIIEIPSKKILRKITSKKNVTV